MPFRYPHLKGSVSSALYYSSINGDHIFFWNGITSFYVVPRLVTRAPRKLSLTQTATT